MRIAAVVLGFMYCFTAVASAQSAPPSIASIEIVPDHISSGVHVHVIVHTSPDVDTIQIDVGFHHIMIPMVSVGYFAGGTTVPKIPWFVRGRFNVTVVARTPSGRRTTARSFITVN